MGASYTNPTTYFAVVPEWLFGLVSDAAIVAYCAIDRFADKNDHTAFPSVKTLAERLGKSESSIKRAIRELEQAGALIRTQRFRADGGKTSNLYQLRRDPQDALTVAHQPAKTAPSPPPKDGRSSNQSQYESKPLFGAGPKPAQQEVKKERPRDPLWDLLAYLLGEPATESERGRRNKALRELRDIGATPDELRQRIDAYKKLFPEMPLTATGIVANWTLLGDHGRGQQLSESERLRLLAERVESRRET